MVGKLIDKFIITDFELYIHVTTDMSLRYRH